MSDISEKKDQARQTLRQFKGDRYVFGLGCLDQLGRHVAPTGRRVSLVVDGFGQEWAKCVHETAVAVLRADGVELAGELIPGAGPNAPREDVGRIAKALAAQKPEAVVAIGGGSTIDATKAANVVVALAGKADDVEQYFGVGKVSELLSSHQAATKPLTAVQLASSSAAHLTKYSNITDMASSQKKLIVDEAVVPARALFDYGVTVTMPAGFTADGALDGVAHCLEVFYGAAGDALAKVRPVAALGIELIVSSLKGAIENPGDLQAREALGLGTDLGGYAIMIGGTNGAHLTSFSLVDLLSHGRACALMNPYYTVFFAPAIQEQLRTVGGIFRRAGYMDADPASLGGRQLGEAVAAAMIALSRDIGFPTTLGEVPGFDERHVARALSAAKDPQLEMKLKNMPVPLTSGQVDEYMAPILEAATSGDFSRIRSMQ